MHEPALTPPSQKPSGSAPRLGSPMHLTPWDFALHRADVHELRIDIHQLLVDMKDLRKNTRTCVWLTYMTLGLVILLMIRL
jgi:hypothetical protein